MKRWRVVQWALDEMHNTDRSVPPVVLRTFWTRWGAKRWSYYKVQRPRALSRMSNGEYAKEWFTVERTDGSSDGRPWYADAPRRFRKAMEQRETQEPPYANAERILASRLASGEIDQPTHDHMVAVLRS